MKDLLLLIGLVTLAMGIYLVHSDPTSIPCRGLLGASILVNGLVLGKIDADHHQEVLAEIQKFSTLKDNGYE